MKPACSLQSERSRRHSGRALLATLMGTLITALLGAAAPALAQRSFVTFESGQVRPLAMTPDGNRLLVQGKPEERIESYWYEGEIDLDFARTPAP